MFITGPQRQSVAFMALLILGLAGCSPIRNTIPPDCVRPGFFEGPRSNKQPIDFSRLRQEPPAVYMLGPGDILGLDIPGVLPRLTERPWESPPAPVHFSDQPNVPPSMGYPVPVGEDGTIRLPLGVVIDVSGLTLPQVEQKILEEYTVRRRILLPEEGREKRERPSGPTVIVTLMRKRLYSVAVIREDMTISGYGYVPAGVGPGFEPERRAITRVVQLPAGENDVLHALAESGGLPGTSAKNVLKIYRGVLKAPATQEQYQQALDNPQEREKLLAGTNVVTIPLRLGPQEQATWTEDDIILHNGDIVFIESRSAEVFYTGGLLRGGQFPIPRDYDLDVFGAIAMSGGSIAATAGSSSAFGGISRGGVGSIFPPTRVIVLRTVNGQQQAVEISLKTAIMDPTQRVLIQPNDFIMLEYTNFELVINILLNNVNLNLSVNELFRGS